MCTWPSKTSIDIPYMSLDLQSIAAANKMPTRTQEPTSAYQASLVTQRKFPAPHNCDQTYPKSGTNTSGIYAQSLICHSKTRGMLEVADVRIGWLVV